MGGDPDSMNKAALNEFAALTAILKQTHSVEKMLHALVDTEAYGAP
jgi:hypothetical protein